MIFSFCRFIMVIGEDTMNYLHVIEVLNRMDKKVIEAKLITYTKNFHENNL